MSSIKVVSLVSFLCIALLGNVSPTPQDTVQVKIQSDEYDGTVSVPRWVLSQAAATGFGIVPNNNWSYDDDSLPSSIKMDSDYYEVRVDLNGYDQDRARVKVLDSRTMRVEAKQRYVNRYGTSTSRSVNRRFTVPSTYDVYRSDARVNNRGIMIISVPNVNGNLNVNRDSDRPIRISY